MKTDLGSSGKVGEGLLGEDIENDTNGDFKRFLISAAQVRSGTLRRRH